MDDEYSDYSCSTSLERLARDLETILRSWHVNNSDRHVSFANDSAFIVPSSEVNNHTTSLSSTSLVSLRSQTLNWEIGFHAQQHRISHDVVLNLQLWDHRESHVPTHHISIHSVDRCSSSASYSSLSSTERTKLRQPSREETLPLSLHPQSHQENFGMNHFSELFGIGQHITLTPVASNIALLPNELLQALLVRIRCDEDNNILPARSVSFGIVEDTNAHFHKYSPVRLIKNTLSGWLQTSCNLAISASSCAIPVFGVWSDRYGGQTTNTSSSSSNHQHAVGVQYATRYPAWMMNDNDLLMELEHIQTCLKVVINNKRRRQNNTAGLKPRRTTSTTTTNPALRVAWPPSIAGSLMSPDTGVFASFTLQWLPHPRNHFFWVWGDFLLDIGNCEHVAWISARRVYEWHTRESIFSQSGRSATLPVNNDDYQSLLQWKSPLPNLSNGEFQAIQVLQNAAMCNSVENPLWGPPSTIDPIESLSAELVWRSQSADSPMVQFPLKVRSKNFDQSDRSELQRSFQNTLLNPSQGEMQLRVKYPENIPATSMTANLRCCCAILIRAATLPHETIMFHLCDPEFVLSWDSDEGNNLATTMAHRGGVSPATLALVAALDWELTPNEVISDEEALKLVQDSVMGVDLDSYDAPQFRYSIPPGRLLSILFMHLVSLRSLCSAAVVWRVFCNEMRELWEQRRFLLNLNNRVKTIAAPETMGARSINAGQINSSEPDPELSSLLIQQKLQLLNVCIECQNNMEQQERESSERQLLRQQRKNSDSIIEDEFFDSNEGEDRSHAIQSISTHHNGVSRDGPSPHRQGARCPVQGTTLQKALTQLYAPYLQRPMPLTDDMIVERRSIMERQKHSHVIARLEIARRLQEPKLLSDMEAFKAANPDATLQDFLSWYGNPKNPMEECLSHESYTESSGLSVEGNDDNISTTSRTSHSSKRSSFRKRSLSFTSSPSQQQSRERLDKAAEAIRVLEDTREFWLRTWSKADPIPASEQKPLFDANNVAERVLDYMETLHPASLFCQVMAANFCTAFFIISVSSADALLLEIVRQTFEHLRSTIENALQHLSANVISAFSGDQEFEENVTNNYLNATTISACESACEAFAETEVFLSRALSLLHKFPGRYELVESILKNPQVNVRQPNDRTIVIDYLENQQRCRFVPPDECPEACVEDYLLKGMDSPTPCQLLVRYCSKRDTDGTQCGSLALAIAKCKRH